MISCSDKACARNDRRCTLVRGCVHDSGAVKLASARVVLIRARVSVDCRVIGPFAFRNLAILSWLHRNYQVDVAQRLSLGNTSMHSGTPHPRVYRIYGLRRLQSRLRSQALTTLTSKDALATITACGSSLAAERLFSPQPSAISGGVFSV